LPKPSGTPASAVEEMRYLNILEERREREI